MATWLISDVVREPALDAVEVCEPGHQEEQRRPGRDRDEIPGRVGRSEERPAEPFDDADERVQGKERLPRLGQLRRRVGDGGGEESELNRERDDVADVAE